MERQDGTKSVHLDLVEDRIEPCDTFARQVEKKAQSGLTTDSQKCHDHERVEAPAASKAETLP
jgi:hypothetical protein